MGRKGMVLKPEWQEVADDFFFSMRDRGCSCFISPPCNYCTHEGNPANLDETDDAWESELVGGIRDAQVPNALINPERRDDGHS